MALIGFLTMGLFIVLVLCLFCTFLLSCWVFPVLTYRKLKKNGLSGPTPSFPLGNLSEMKKKSSESSSSSNKSITHDIHATLFPYFARWQKAYGKIAPQNFFTSPNLVNSKILFMHAQT